MWMQPFGRVSLGIAAAFLLVLGSGSAHAKKKKQHRFLGPHPLSAKTGDNYCYIEVPHVHKDAPPAKHKALYRDQRGQSQFVGDPTPYGYEGKTHPYYGHHPVAVEVAVGARPRYESGQQLEYCYLDGPHSHIYAPPAGITFESKGGANWYIGEYPPTYKKQRSRYYPANNVYASVEYDRPTVVVEARPVGYIGPVVVIDDHHRDHPVHAVHPGRGHGPPHAHGHVGVGVHVEVPTIEVGIGHHHKHHKHHKHKHFKGKRYKHRGGKRGHW